MKEKTKRKGMPDRRLFVVVGAGLCLLFVIVVGAVFWLVPSGGVPAATVVPATMDMAQSSGFLPFDDVRSIMSVDVNRAGTHMLVASTDGLSLYPISATEQESPQVGNRWGGDARARFHPRGDRLLIVAPTLRVVEILNNDAQFTSRQVYEGFTAGAFSPDGLLLALSGDGVQLVILSLSSGQPVNVLSLEQPVQALAWHPAGRQVAVGYVKATGETDIAIYDRESRALSPVFYVAGQRIADLRFNPAGDTLAVATDDNLQLIDVAANEQRFYSTGILNALAYSPDGRWLAAGAVGDDDSPGAIALWRWADSAPNTPQGLFEEQPRLLGHQAPVTTLVFTPDNRYLVSGAGDGVIRWWDLEAASN